MSRTPAHTISTEWVKIDGADRLRVGIDLTHDFATIYLHPETVESLRVALGAAPVLEPEILTWDVVFGDGARWPSTYGETSREAISRAAALRWTLGSVLPLGADQYRGECAPHANASGFDFVVFTATATPAATEPA